MNDSFYSANEEQDFEGPFTCSRVKALAKVITLINEFFNVKEDKTDNSWLSGLLQLERIMALVN